MGGVRPLIRRGEVWDAEFDPVRGREQAGRRPAVIVSADRFHQGRSSLAYVVPVTRTDRRSPWQVRIDPPEGGLNATSFVMCDQLRVFSLDRLLRWRGWLDPASLRLIEDRIGVLLDL